MNITFKLYATLATSLPADAHKNQVKISVPENTTIMDLIEKYNVNKELCHLILVNGNYTPFINANQTILNEGDTLAIWPPVAGG